MGGLLLRFFIFLLFAFVFTGAGLEAKSFWYVKQSDGLIESQPSRLFDIRFEKEASSVSILSDKLLDGFYYEEEIPLYEEIQPMEQTDIETGIEAAFLLISGALLIADLQAYRLSSEFELHSLQAVAFFFLPISEKYLYRTCHQKSYLVATTAEPKDQEALDRLKSADEVDLLCGNLVASAF